jgi:hypothetical protein
VVQDSDPAHYFGELIDIELVKTVNGDDANTAPGPAVPVGGPVLWVFEIRNNGNVPVTWAITDPQFGTLACPRVLLLRAGRSIVCHANSTATLGPHTNTATATGTSILETGQSDQDADPANYIGAGSSITIEKATNGLDADTAPGPFVSVGGDVDWTYVVTNTGDTVLDDVVVVDLRGEAVSCPPEIEPLDPGEVVSCSASGTAEDVRYQNTGVVTAANALGERLFDADPSHYVGAASGVDIEKETNGDDADEEPGPLVPVGETVEWRYIVSNSGTELLEDIVVTDDQGVEVTCPADTLPIGGSMVCTGSGPAELGQYENVGTVVATGIPPEGEVGVAQQVTDSDPSHYFGFVSQIDITKFVNGEDANTSPGVQVPVGDPVVMTFVVTNSGNIPITNVEVVDDQGLAVAFLGGDTDGDEELDPGETWNYEAPLGPATPGRFDNVGTVTGFDSLEQPVTDNDPAFVFAAAPPAPPAPQNPAPVPAAPGSGGLAGTGIDAVPLAVLALALLVAGATLLRLERARRSRPAH